MHVLLHDSVMFIAIDRSDDAAFMLLIGSIDGLSMIYPRYRRFTYGFVFVFTIYGSDLMFYCQIHHYYWFGIVIGGPDSWFIARFVDLLVGSGSDCDLLDVSFCRLGRDRCFGQNRGQIRRISSFFCCFTPFFAVFCPFFHFPEFAGFGLFSGSESSNLAIFLLFFTIFLIFWAVLAIFWGSEGSELPVLARIPEFWLF